MSLIHCTAQVWDYSCDEPDRPWTDYLMDDTFIDWWLAWPMLSTCLSACLFLSLSLSLWVIATAQTDNTRVRYRVYRPTKRLGLFIGEAIAHVVEEAAWLVVVFADCVALHLHRGRDQASLRRPDLVVNGHLGRRLEARKAQALALARDRREQRFLVRASTHRVPALFWLRDDSNAKSLVRLHKHADSLDAWHLLQIGLHLAKRNVLATLEERGVWGDWRRGKCRGGRGWFVG